MILLEPNFVNTDFRIYFGTRIRHSDYSEKFINSYLTKINKITGIDKFILMEQIHSATIRRILSTGFRKYKNISYSVMKRTDGIYTDRKGIALCIKTADCMPVFVIADNTAAAIHMGWRGAQSRIVEIFIQLILFPKKIPPERIHLIIGPHIRDCCYSVGQEIIYKFEENGYKTDTIFRPTGEKPFLSLEASLYEQAEKCGIPSKNIFSTNICTSCLNNLFYSYRNGDRGRNISLIIRK